MTILISAIWIGAVLWLRVENPLTTLLYAGIAYGVMAILLSAIASPILEGQLQGPITNPLAIISVILTNAVWGILTGLIAVAVQRTQVKS